MKKPQPFKPSKEMLARRDEAERAYFAAHDECCGITPEERRRHSDYMEWTKTHWEPRGIVLSIDDMAYGNFRFEMMTTTEIRGAATLASKAMASEKNEARKRHLGAFIERASVETHKRTQ